ncbi:LAGLIDADG family homing endonuclease [Nonomuraea sp. NPDC049141]|uniref:LAGLIDADG family homing endonuclease n=1 Tax=Nonomuraea sp. NPDC049141 TaxID=3155500 RepID=UPI0033DE070E
MTTIIETPTGLDGWAAAAKAATAGLPEMAPCPECLIDRKVNAKSGTIRKHKADKADVLPCTGSGAVVGNARVPRRSRGYYRDPETGDRLRSVTTILDQGMSKSGLVYWAAKVVAQTAMDRVGDMLRVSRTPEEREEFIKWLKLEPVRRRDDRGDIGRAVHRLIEARILGEPAPAGLASDPEFRSYLAHFTECVEKWQLRFIASEMVVAHPEHGFGGTLDYLFTSPLVAARVGLPADTIFPGDTKGLALDTPLPTPTGWTTMGAVQVGDTLLGSDGRPCTVTETSEVHYRDCYRVTFDDGSSVICDDEHLWLTESGHPQWRTSGVHSTVEIAATLLKYGKRHHRVRVADPLELPPTALPVEPYVLGRWLGDGKHTSGEVSSQDQEIFDSIHACGYAVGPPQKVSREGGCPVRSVLGLVGDLRKAGVLGDKHIPAAYLRASREQRLALLQGLMDTDGTWNRRRNCAQLVTSSKEFAISVRELVLSLGLRAAMFEMNHTGFKPGTHYLITFTPRSINPFRLTRKAELAHVPNPDRASRRLIVSVEPTLTVPTKCIAVDSSNRTFLCGETMIPTHNTGGELDATTYSGHRHGVYPQAGAQMAAYRAAPWGWLRDGTKIRLPERAPIGIIMHLRPEGWRLYPARCGDDMYAVFRNAQAMSEFETRHSKNVIGEALVLPEPTTPATRKVA